MLDKQDPISIMAWSLSIKFFPEDGPTLNKEVVEDGSLDGGGVKEVRGFESKINVLRVLKKEKRDWKKRRSEEGKIKK